MTASPFEVRVYYEDTDLAGVVYHANHLKYMERARTEALRSVGVDQGVLKAETGIVFLVTRVAIHYLRPAFFDDLLAVDTAVTRLGSASLTLGQSIRRGVEAVATAEVRVAIVGSDGRAARAPGRLREALSRL
ncbi:tol-pal system-associated acyl-CoA thioesterase [Rubrimonas cliftonensis]|uniref:Acyl-CoA thioester hydrolase n=1 Tax=Rubrimonas cliftonensis TaxID=89524 RepID=A0A1H4BX35_9RHOB|nr:tol-pal system-associated acyl-CoA thioesterase [Rubrimonas cliftonensis]SEA52765.1 acyl-CoA thioester hydrolase [Rubrimonas cliftonensis]